MQEKNIIKEVGIKYGLSEKQANEMYEQFNNEYLMFNLYNLDWMMLNYPGLGTFTVNLLSLRAKIKFYEKLIAEKEKLPEYTISKKLLNNLERFRNIEKYIEEYNAKNKNKRYKG